jgi:ATP-dependent Lon protease
MDELDKKLIDAFEGKVVRKDLLHRIKKGTNVPTFVLEFLLARYCASDAPAEIQAGLDAVLATLQDNYVRPDEANAAQSKVALNGKHRFIDKVHVNYSEREKRHWAALENFNSQRIAIAEKFYRDNERLLEGGIWPGAKQAHAAVEVPFHFAAGIAGRTQLQLHRVGAARHGQIVLLQRILAVCHAGQRRPGHQGHAVLQQRPQAHRAGGLLGRGRVRRGRRHQRA